MTLELRIEQALNAYVTNPIKGLAPKKMLVGRTEAERLFEKALVRTGSKFTIDGRNGDRLMYRQLHVYVVDQESYLWFAP